MYKDSIEADELKSDDFKKLKKEKEALYPATFNSDAVKGVQSFLNEEGYKDKKGEKLFVDGRYGAKTANAVMDYQRENGLSVDGIVGDETWDSIYNKKKKKEEQIKPRGAYVPETKQDPRGIYEPDEVNDPRKIGKSEENKDVSYTLMDNETRGEYFSTTESRKTPVKLKNETQDEEINWLQEAFRIEEEAAKTKDETIDALQKEVQREIWKQGSKVALKDCPVSKFMLEHSLQDNPTTMVMGNESDIAKLIVQDPVYLNALDKAIANSDGETIDTDLEGIAFDTPDLYYSIHKATIHVKGYKNKEGNWIITAMLEDTYDFTEWMTLSKDEDGKWIINISKGTVANDVAKISQMSGAINPYEIRVYFNTVR